MTEIEGTASGPRLAAARSWLTEQEDPRAAIAVARLTGSSPVREMLASQRADGSWGRANEPRSRILATLWMVKLLAELGVDDGHDGWHGAVSFLAQRGHASGGVFSVDGTDAGVLSCYVGIAGETYLRGGRADLAEPQVAWIVRHQEIRVGGVSRRQPAAVLWDERLRTRYGGCMASTSCLIGLVKTGHALRRWIERAENEPASAMLRAIREVFLERRLLYRRDGTVVPLGGSGAQAGRWLEPAFPLDWHTDLVEVLDLVAGPEGGDERVAPALARLAASQLADGSWPLRVSYMPSGMSALERRSQNRGSPFVTSRIVAVLDRLTAPGG